MIIEVKTPDLPIGIKEIGASVRGIPIDVVKIKDFFIPEWPSGLEVKIKLWFVNMWVPQACGKTNLLRLRRRRLRNLSVKIDGDGALEFRFRRFGWGGTVCRTAGKEGGKIDFSSSSMWAIDRHDLQFDRLFALLLFHQFRARIREAVVRKLETDSIKNNEVVQLVKTAFEPFIPGVVAKQLSE